MAKSSRGNALSYAVRARVVLRHLGHLCLVQAVLLVPPIVVAFVTASFEFAARACAVLLTVAASGLLLRRVRAPRKVQRNEALAISALAFLLSPLVLTVPMVGFELSHIDALFEAVSGVTTTGLTMLRTTEGKPAALIFLRAWLQWYGGLGIVALSLAVLIRPGVSSRRISAAEYREEDLFGGIRAHARRIIFVYLGMTGLGVLLLVVVGISPWNGLIHTLAGASTGGFSSLSNSLAGIDGWGRRAAVMLVSFSGAVCLPLYYRLGGRHRRDLLTDTEFRLLGILSLTVSALLLAGLVWQQGLDWLEALGHALVMGFSAQTTTGFSSMPSGELPASGKIVIILSMFIGGSLGSTAGGIKIIRFLVVLRLLQALFWQTTHTTHTVTQPRLRGKILKADMAVDSLLVICLFVLVNVGAWVAFLVAGYDPLNSLFDVVSATGTVGLSTGVTSTDLPTWLKAVLCFNMTAGRVEVLALLVLVYPRTWIGRRKEPL